MALRPIEVFAPLSLVRDKPLPAPVPAPLGQPRDEPRQSTRAPWVHFHREIDEIYFDLLVSTDNDHDRVDAFCGRVPTFPLNYLNNEPVDGEEQRWIRSRGFLPTNQQRAQWHHNCAPWQLPVTEFLARLLPSNTLVLLLDTEGMGYPRGELLDPFLGRMTGMPDLVVQVFRVLTRGGCLFTTTPFIGEYMRAPGFSQPVSTGLRALRHYHLPGRTTNRGEVFRDHDLYVYRYLEGGTSATEVALSVQWPLHPITQTQRPLQVRASVARAAVRAAELVARASGAAGLAEAEAAIKEPPAKRRRQASDLDAEQLAQRRLRRRAAREGAALARVFAQGKEAADPDEADVAALLELAADDGGSDGHVDSDLDAASVGLESEDATDDEAPLEWQRQRQRRLAERQKFDQAPAASAAPARRRRRQAPTRRKSAAKPRQRKKKKKPTAVARMRGRCAQRGTQKPQQRAKATRVSLSG